MILYYAADVKLWKLHSSDLINYLMQVPGRFDLRGHDDLKQLQQMYGMIGEDSSPPENITYVSRLQVCQYYCT